MTQGLQQRAATRISADCSAKCVRSVKGVGSSMSQGEGSGGRSGRCMPGNCLSCSCGCGYFRRHRSGEAAIHATRLLNAAPHR